MNALDKLREGLREAARRDIQTKQVRDLVSIGEPVPVRAGQTADCLAADGAHVQIGTVAPSGDELPFAVGTNRARNGDEPGELFSVQFRE